MSMRSHKVFQILANEGRELAETSSWSAPSISRQFLLAETARNEFRTFVGGSTEIGGKETFFRLDKGKHTGIGHTTRGEGNLRLFHNAQGEQIGHEAADGTFVAAQRHVHVHGKEHHAPHPRIRKSGPEGGRSA